MATVITCLVLTVCVGLVVIGGLKRIAKVSEIVVPFMAILYVALGLIIIVTNITEVPAAIVSIVKSAFTGSAPGRRVMGSMVIAMQQGIARGIFSNESGLGSAPIAAAAAVTKEPARQGLVSMTGTFIDTIVICTIDRTFDCDCGINGLIRIWKVFEITMDAFQKALPFPPAVASFSLMLCLVFFAFTTILGWNFTESGAGVSVQQKSVPCKRIPLALYPGSVFIGPYMTVAAVWNIADIFNALMAFPNLVALLALNGVVKRESKDYFTRLKAENK